MIARGSSSRWLVAVVLGLWAAGASAAEVNGFLNSRTQWTRARFEGLLPTRDLPQFLQTVELNAQVRQSYTERSFVSGDLSLFLHAGGTYRSRNADGEEVVVGDHDSPFTRPSVSLNELYVNHEVRPELNLLAGKKRVVWGSGLAFNPTDLLNPPKDPTDPSLQRAGAWMARVEVPLETLAFTLLFAPGVTEEFHGLPRRLLYDAQDAAHFLVAARAYALVLDSDLNLMAFYSDRFGDAFEDKLRWGASFSRVFDAVEVHFEALLQTGSARAYPQSGCVRDVPAALACAQNGTALFARDRLEDPALYARALVGARYQSEEETLFSVEYLYQGDGYTPTQFQDQISALALVDQARARGLEPAGMEELPLAGEGGGGSTRFSFQPSGQHYLFLTFQQPKIRDDFTLGLVLITSLQDLSGVFAPSLAWSATEWLNVTASAFLPYAGPDALGATRPPTQERIHEYSLLPMKYRAMLELRAFY